MEPEQNSLETVPTTRTPLVFISHDTRDAALAEAFSQLLSSVSAGVLKSFRSSDRKGTQGIAYGVEWYPEIMKKLEVASDVVCLLTANSVGRPWILYEAGVAKGKLETPVHGVALGIPLQNASTGPFAQFQNSDDSEDALTQLVMQLVRRIPGAEPDREVVKSQVVAFKAKISKLIEEDENQNGTTPPEESDATSVAKIFEEVKVMFQDLPSRVANRIDPDSAFSLRRPKRYRREFVKEALFLSKVLPEDMAFLIGISPVKEDFPWLYDLAFDVFRKLSSRQSTALAAIKKFENIFQATFRHPVFRERIFRSNEFYREFEELEFIIPELLARLRDRVRSKPPRQGNLR
jgi:hypothetical protein